MEVRRPLLTRALRSREFSAMLAAIGARVSPARALRLTEPRHGRRSSARAA